MAPQDPPITVTFYDTETEDELPFELHPDQEIRAIYKLFDDYNVKEPESYYLAYNGEVLHKGWKIKDAGIPNGGRIDICTRKEITVTFQGALDANAVLTTDLFIGDLIHTLSGQINQPANLIYVYWNGQQLDPGLTFLGLSIPNDSTLEVKVEEKMTIVVRFPTSEMPHEFSLYSTIDDIFEQSKSSLGDVTVLGYHATFKSKPILPTDTLKDLGVEFMDKIIYEIDIAGG